MTDLNAQTARIAVKLRGHFVPHPGYGKAYRAALELWYKRYAELEAGRSSEGRGVVIIGKSGSGKTTAAQKILTKLDCEDSEAGEKRTISLRVPTPATQKDLARAILHALDFPIMRNSTASRMWELVHHQLKLRKTWLIHFDEGQELGSRGSDTERAGVINALKSLMQIKGWPINVLISGTPELSDLISKDFQLFRRFCLVHFLPVTELDPPEKISTLICDYARYAEVEIDPDLMGRDFIARLVHASSEQFGIIIELIIGAISNALNAGRRLLTISDFAACYAVRTGRLSGGNPFTSEHFRDVPTGRTPALMDPERVMTRRRG